MKKIVLFFALCQISIFAFAQNFSVGAYFNASNQNANFFDESDFLKPQRIIFQGWEYGIYFNYNLKENISLKTRIGYSQNAITLCDILIVPAFQYYDFPIIVGVKTTMLSFFNFNIYIENGISAAFCNSYSYNRVIGASNIEFTGSISDYNFKNKWSVGFVNGIGISYLIKSKFEIDVFANYYSGLNKVWENNSILIVKDGVINNYTISSNGSSINIGLGFGYCF
ncbi:MAG: hypothetical protein PHH30_11030 [Bacteroidales bacterium]|nr:hypothetical protein [Bacteroidales bacterium]MDD3858763.1 hypothetical protein [Bacteroidales bacterium]